LTTTAAAVSGPLLETVKREAVGAGRGVDGAGLGDREVRAGGTITLAEALLLPAFGSGVELETPAVLVSVVSCAITVAVIVIVAVELAASAPSEQETVASQLPGWSAR
jgi:hypothetical protein